jgi:hypothetical protein
VGKAGYKVWSNSHAKTKFTGKNITVHQCYKKYMELLPHNEMYEVAAPTVSVNNLILGTPYIDIGGKQTIRNLKNGEYCVMEFHTRGWTGTGYKVEGEVFNERKQCVYKIEGRWNESISLINAKTGEKTVVF